MAKKRTTFIEKLNSSTKQRHKDKLRQNKKGKTQQNSKCSDRDETTNHIISKLTQKEYKARQNWMGKVILWKLCNEFRSKLANKWYMLNLESVLESETHTVLWDLEI